MGDERESIDECLEKIMGEHAPKDSILLSRNLKKVPSLSYFHQFLCLDSKLHKRARPPGLDTLMLIDTIRALIDLYHLRRRISTGHDTD